MIEINKPLLNDKKLNDVIEEINLCYKHFSEQCDLIDAQLLDTLNNHLNYEIENRINLKNKYNQLKNMIQEALNNTIGIIIDDVNQKKITEIKINSEKRYNNIIHEYNKLYILVNNEEIISNKERRPSIKRVVIETEYSSSVSSTGISIEEKTKQIDENNDRYYFFVTIAIFLFFAFVLMFYFNKLMK